MCIIFYLLLISQLGFAQSFEKVTSVDLPGAYLGFISWADINNDGQLDVFTSGVDYGETNYLANIFRNNGNDTFIQIKELPSVIYGDIKWGDINNDGYLDFLYSGTKSGFPVDNYTALYKNKGDNDFELIDIPIPDLDECYLEFVDFNNDGLVDIFYEGNNSSNNFSIGILRNIGSDSFIKINTNITGISGGRGNFTHNSMTHGDYDNDGDEDILIGLSSVDTFCVQMYRNDGNFNFTKIQTSIENMNYTNFKTIDIDNDGQLDIIETGSYLKELNSYDKDSKIFVYKNKGSLNFEEKWSYTGIGALWNVLDVGDINVDGMADIILHGAGPSNQSLYTFMNKGNDQFELVDNDLPDCEMGGIKLGNFNNDNILDIIYSGRFQPSETEATYIFLNASDSMNNKPSVPVKLSHQINARNAILTWNRASDDLTDSLGLIYSIQVFDTAGKNIVSGLNYLGNYGEMHINNKFYLNNLHEGKYFWEVRSIDNSFVQSDYSSVDSFIIKSENTGIDKVNNKVSFTLYPNPCKNYISIDLSLIQNVDLIEISDMNGKVLYKKDGNIGSTEIINTSLFEKGIYIIKLNTDNEIHLNKFIKI